jgi:4-amino-4-deoxy-L-arabinose transferase-like glycosyltransferase
MNHLGIGATDVVDSRFDVDGLRHNALARVIRWRWTLPLAVALIGLVLQTIVAFQMSPTADESVHVAYGIATLKGHPERDPGGQLNFGFDSKMPVSVLNALPHGVGKLLRTHGVAVPLGNWLSEVPASRIPTVIATFAFSLLVYVYAQALYGRLSALVAELLFVMAPNIMAHASLATTDLFSALSVVLFLYSFRRLCVEPAWRTAFTSAMVLAFAQLTKFSSLYLYFVVAVFAASAWLYARFKGEPLVRVSRRQTGMFAALIVICSLVVINAGFLFNRTMTPLAGYQFLSPGLKALQQVPVVSKIPLPLPYPYIQGFDMMNFNNIHGTTIGNIYMLGQVRGPGLERSDGFPAYYLVAYLFKEPLGMQLILLLSLIWIARRRRPSEFLRTEWPMFLTAVTFLAALSFTNRTQIGIRHILPVLAIFVIASGAAFADWRSSGWRYRALLSACLVWTAISVASYYPQMIPYFNELLTDRKMAFRILADSNLDWDQDRWAVEDFMRKNPDVVLDPSLPVAGRVLVRGDLMAGVCPRTADYWVRLNALRPIGQVGYAHFLFEVRDPAALLVRHNQNPPCSF